MKKTWFIFVWFVALSTSAQITDIKNINEISINNVSTTDLFVFDLDNTVIQPKQTLASDQWFRGYWSKLKSQGYSDEEVKDRLIPIYNATKNVTDEEVVEKEVVAIIDNLKQNGATVIGLTARNFELVTPTTRHLDSASVKFSDTHRFAAHVNQEFVYAKNGVIFANGQDKGDCLDAYLKEHNISPQRIVFVDDSLKNVKSVKKYADNNNIPFRGYRYGYLDQKVSEMSLEVAEIQLQNMRIMSDEEVMA